VTLDARRTFTRQETWRAWQLQGRVCHLCRRDIPFDLLQGDHIVPWSQGGRTSSENLQAICGSRNLRKGNTAQSVVDVRFSAGLLNPSTAPLRPWQAEAMPIALSPLGREPVLVEACPGAGKTRFGLKWLIGSQGRGSLAGPFPHSPFNPCVRFSRTRLTDDLLDWITQFSDSAPCHAGDAGHAR
jgi:hypothetical protein